MGMKSLMPCLGMSMKSYCQWALSNQPFQGDGQFFEMPVVWYKTNVYECLLFHNIYSAEHDAFYKAVHCEVLYGSAIEELMFHRVGDDKSRGIEEEAEIVGPVWVAWHTVCLEILDVFYPKFHLTAFAISFVDGFGWIVPVLRDNEPYIGSLGAYLDLGYDALLMFPTLCLVVQLEIPTYHNIVFTVRAMEFLQSLLEIILGTSSTKVTSS